MWYVFPQLDGLAFSSTSKIYAIKSLAEAEAYLRHPVLGPRLIECTEAVLGVEGRSAGEIFGYTDEMKLRSCATLFASRLTCRVGIRSPAHQVLPGRTRRQDAPPARERTRRPVSLPDRGQHLPAGLYRLRRDQDDRQHARRGPVVHPVVDRPALDHHVAGLEVDRRVVELHVDLAQEHDDVVDRVRAVVARGQPR